MTDIVERLRNWEQVDIVDAHEDGALYNAAADEIERLRYSLSMILHDLKAMADINYIPSELFNDHIYITARKLLVKENGNET